MNGPRASIANNGAKPQRCCSSEYLRALRDSVSDSTAAASREKRGSHDRAIVCNACPAEYIHYSVHVRVVYFVHGAVNLVE